MTTTRARAQRNADEARSAQEAETLAYYADKFDEAIDLWLNHPNVSFLIRVEVCQRFHGNTALLDDALARIRPDARTQSSIEDGAYEFAAINFVNQRATEVLRQFPYLVPRTAVLPEVLMQVFYGLAQRDIDRRNRQG